MNTVKSGALLSGVVLLGLGFGGAALAQDNCADYAQLSAAQQQRNQAAGCGMSGDGWSTDKKQHMAYCQSVGPDEWVQALQAREAKLTACGG